MSEKSRRSIEVVGCALLKEGRIFIARRPPYDDGAVFWEFPGGKIDPGETPEQALHREIREELQIEIRILEDLGFIHHAYPQTDVKLHLYLCEQVGEGEIQLVEHDAMEWVDLRQLDMNRLLGADRPFVEPLCQAIARRGGDFLRTFGWNEFFEKQVDPSLDRHRLGRIVSLEMGSVTLMTHEGEGSALIQGKLRKPTAGRDELPTVGDWVVFRNLSEKPWVVERRLERQTVLVRKSPRGDLQALAANVNFVLVANSLNEDLSHRRMERYLSMCYAAGAEPILLLTKSDLVPEPEKILAETVDRFPGVKVFLVSVPRHQGVDEVRALFTEGVTGVLVGSSGVGKSSLLNALIGNQVRETSEIRQEDGKGRHTTVTRALFRLPGGGLLIDNPGLRELQLADAEEGVETLFSDLAELTLKCKFSNCTHQSEPHCAVKAAMAEGRLDLDRWESYQKLLRETEEQASRGSKAESLARKEKHKKLNQAARASIDFKRRNRSGDESY